MALIDMKAKLPLVTKDWRELHKRGVQVTNLKQPSVEDMFVLVSYVYEKCGIEKPTESVDSLSIKELSEAVVEIFNADESMQVDRPI